MIFLMCLLWFFFFLFFLPWHLPLLSCRKEKSFTFKSCPASLAGLSLHHKASCSRVTPYCRPCDHVTGRTNCRCSQENEHIYYRQQFLSLLHWLNYDPNNWRGFFFFFFPVMVTTSVWVAVCLGQKLSKAIRKSLASPGARKVIARQEMIESLDVRTRKRLALFHAQECKPSELPFVNLLFFIFAFNSIWNITCNKMFMVIRMFLWTKICMKSEPKLLNLNLLQ